MLEFFVYFIIFIFSYTGVEIFRRWSERRKVFDHPNERSSHTTPTPRGGGLIIAVGSLTAYSLYTIFVTGNFAWSYLLGAILIVSVSWLDDLYSISFVWRFLAHSASAILIILSLGYFEEIYLPTAEKINLGVIGGLITFFWIVWLTNAYNFMDGIDGIAGMQAVTAGVGWLMVGKFLDVTTVGFYGGVIACSSLGFLLHNWSPAKIFMGDVGSAFLGYSFAAFPLLAKNDGGQKSEHQPILNIIAVLLIWLFVFDPLWTFLRRVLNREKVWQAHRGHLYQKFIRAGFSHWLVTGLYGLLSILTVSITTLWIINRDVWENVLIFWVLVESLGLIIGSYLVRQEKVY